MSKTDTISALVDRFLAWPLPNTVCSDLCVTDRDYKFPRSGTCLLSADEARQMIEYLFAGHPVIVAAREEADKFFAKDATFDKASFVDGAAFAVRVMAS
jgi:hypothetical protein